MLDLESVTVFPAQSALDQANQRIYADVLGWACYCSFKLPLLESKRNSGLKTPLHKDTSWRL